MQLLVLEKRKWAVVAITATREDGPPACPVLDFLRDQQASDRASAKGFRALFKRYADLGREGLTQEQFHLANQSEKIWEFIKGRIRIYCFEDGDVGMIVLTHGIHKQRQKTLAADVGRAARARALYLEHKKLGGLTIKETLS